MTRKKFPKVKAFAMKAFEENQLVKPSEIKEKYETAFPEAPVKSLSCYQKALNRCGLGLANRKLKVEEKRAKDSKDISQYAEVQNYIASSEMAGITRLQLNKQLDAIREVWEMMGKSNPYSDTNRWNYKTLMAAIKEKVPMEETETGAMRFSNKGKVQQWLSAVNTMFPSILQKGWSNIFNQQKLSLKDYLSFEEYAAFIENLADTENLSKEGWIALFNAQVNGALREGSKGVNGVLGLKWENINYKTKRISANEKGGKGKAGRIWLNIPLDLYPFIHGWEHLNNYHFQKFGYYPSNDKHETGRIFPVNYDEYTLVFHATRKLTNGRIAADKEAFRPHIFRKTHANWNHKLGVPMEMTCGDYPNGFFGVGWDNPAILKKYYLVQEEEDIIEAQEKMNGKMAKLGLV